MIQDNREPNDTELSLDACLELLSNRQRRVVLRHFLETDADHAPVDELIAEIMDEEAAVTGQRPGHDSVAATLYHIHLPKFSDAGVLEYDTRHLEVRYRGNSQLEEMYRKIRDVQ